jgi:hypothetical protein
MALPIRAANWPGARDESAELHHAALLGITEIGLWVVGLNVFRPVGPEVLERIDADRLQDRTSRSARRQPRLEEIFVDVFDQRVEARVAPGELSRDRQVDPRDRARPRRGLRLPRAQMRDTPAAANAPAAPWSPPSQPAPNTRRRRAHAGVPLQCFLAC